MNRLPRSLFILFLLMLGTFSVFGPNQSAASNVPSTIHQSGPSRPAAITKAASVPPLPVIGVWSSQYSNWNITDPNLVAGSSFSVQINVTNAPSFNGYEFALYFDPTYLNVSSYDLKAGLFTNPFVAREFTGNGSLRLGVVNVGPLLPPSSGILVGISFKVVKAGGVSPLTLAAPTTNPSQFSQAPDAFCKNCPAGTPNWTRLVAGSSAIEVQTSDGYFKNGPGLGPIASFVFNPTNPSQGDVIVFNATNSFDPDNFRASSNGILKYLWDFGDKSIQPNPTTSAPFTTHVFAPASYPNTGFTGNFSIRLTVVDADNGFQGMKTVRLAISPTLVPPQHNISVSLSISTSQAFQGQNVSLFVFVINNGTTPETYGLTVVYHPLGVLQNVTLVSLTGQTLLPGAWIQGRTFNLNTTSLAIGTYIFVATITDPLDTNPFRHASLAQLSVVAPDEPPTAAFTFTPLNPVVGVDVLFNGNSSLDPDGMIFSWTWFFGDGYTVFGFSNPVADHVYSVAGNYTVTLTVRDNSGLSASSSMIVHVLPRPQHDVALTLVAFYPPVAISGQRLSLEAGIVNTGSNASTVDLTFYYNGKVAVTQRGVFISPSPYTFYVNVQWDTTGVPAGNYTISATVFLTGDPTPSDNSLTGGFLKLLPPPVITLTPSSGPVGTLVLVHGSGFFPNATGQFFPVELEMTFDNQLVGFFFPQGSSFDFSFDVPDAQVGAHTVHAMSVYPFNLDVQAAFTVTPTSTGISVSLSVGSIYFPGDTATIFVLTSLNGQPSPVGTLQVILIRPDGTNLTLSTIRTATGLYKASYLIPARGLIGTYAVTVRAHQTGSLDGSALASFEVKPSWLTSNSKNITTGVAITGLVGVAALAWRRGYFRKNDEEETP